MDGQHRFWINDIRDGVYIPWSHQEPYGQWGNQASPHPPPQVSPLTIPLEYLWSDVKQDEDYSY